MAKKNFTTESEKKQALGKLIVQCRGDYSQRQLAKLIDIPPSNLTYIENGVNAPSPEVYFKIIQTLNPKPKIRQKMDKLYMEIRKLPPPDVCKEKYCNEKINFDLLHAQIKEVLNEALINDKCPNCEE